MNIACQQHTVLVVGGDLVAIRFITSAASRGGWRVATCGTLEDALSALSSDTASKIGVAALDQASLGASAQEFLQELKKLRPELPVLVVASQLSCEAGVELICAGASDYLVRPVDPDRLLQSLRLAVSDDASPRELQPLAEQLTLPHRFEALIGADPAFRKALARAAKAARTHKNVVVVGEGGTGKGTLLQAIHSASPRSTGPLKVIRARAFSSAALESALFGHEAGAIPGAFTRQEGALGDCDGGALIVDEINRMPLAVQERFADALSTRRVRPTGASHSFRVDVRVLASSTQPLMDLLERGDMSCSLCEALSAEEIFLPPLRNRRGDIAALSRFFLSKINEQSGSRELALSDGAVSLLTSFDWPGNVRQLQAAIFRAAMSCDNEVLKPENFVQLLSSGDGNVVELTQLDVPRGGVQLFTDEGHLRPLEEIETDVIRLAIGHYRGRMSEVARRLGIGRSTLYRKISELSEDTGSEAG